MKYISIGNPIRDSYFISFIPLNREQTEKSCQLLPAGFCGGWFLELSRYLMNRNDQKERSLELRVI